MMGGRNASVVVLVAVSLVLGAGCTGSPPEVLYADTQITLLRDPQTGVIAETLRLYVAVHDPDGPDDVARIFLVNDEAQLYWELTAEAWVSVEYGGNHWYGMPDVRMPDGEHLPRGRYSVIAEDRGLSRTQTQFFLTNEPLLPDVAFPGLIVGDTTLSVAGDGEVVLRVYNRSGQMVVNQVLVPGVVPDQVMDRIPEESGLRAFVSTLEDGVRRESGPYALPR